jgi:hypothetical protein
MCDYYILLFSHREKNDQYIKPKNTYPDGPEGEKEKPHMI